MAFEAGDRVELVRCTDLMTRLAPGDKGTVVLEDSTGVIHVKWDSGSGLSMIPEAGDRIRKI
jgi:hypothetical protein